MQPCATVVPTASLARSDRNSQVLSAYGIATTPASLARDPDEAAAAAKPHLDQGSAVVLKIQSPDIVHKSEVGGVQLNLTSEHSVRQAAADILARARVAKPDARIDGVTVFPMVVRPKARELIVGVADDPTFGPVIVFGQGGTAVEAIGDKALALPPLDLALAHGLIARTRVSRILKAYRNVPAADKRRSRCFWSSLRSSRRISRKSAKSTSTQCWRTRPASSPLTPAFQSGLWHCAAQGRCRAIRASRYGLIQRTGNATCAAGQNQDFRAAHPARGRNLVSGVLGRRDAGRFAASFFCSSQGIQPQFHRAIYPDRLCARHGVHRHRGGTGRMLGVVRIHANSEYRNGEYAILVRSDLKGHGLGWLLMELMIEYARAEGLQTLHGQVLRENSTMLQMCRQLGFQITYDLEDFSLSSSRWRCELLSA